MPSISLFIDGKLTLSKKKRGDWERGSPCLIPLWFWKGEMGDPSTSIEKDEDNMEFCMIIQIRGEKPMAFVVESMTSHLTVPKAFSSLC